MSELAHDWDGAATTVATHGANPARGEASIRVAGETLVLRPSFAALVAAEAELGGDATLDALVRLALRKASK